MQRYRYTVIFVLILSAVSALVLAGMYAGLKEAHQKNELLFKKRSVLRSIEHMLSRPVSEMSDAEVDQLFHEKIRQYVLDAEGNILPEEKLHSLGLIEDPAIKIDRVKESKKPLEQQLFPLYVFEKDGKKYYILEVLGKGLWDLIWAFVALEEDLNTVAGIAFDHAAETPGLGAEIKDNPNFAKQFIGKKIYDQNGNYRSITVRKGGAKDPLFEVDAISGATLTCDGVTEMLYRGIKYYEPFFKKIHSKQIEI